MCGIAGELRFDQQPADLAALEKITHHLAPRGPDACGFHSSGPLAFGHRRLKIMDLAPASGQPMIDHQLGLSLVFNGAIYNYPELRTELQALGYQFHSDGDTEVLLKGYHAWGEQLLPKLNGMFAFAIWERDRERLFLARDRLGIKPLYLTQDGARLRFASTLPALLQGGGIDTGLDPVALNHYLNFHAVVPAPRTLLRGVEKLPPASWLRLDLNGNREQQCWWQLEFGPHRDEISLELPDWRERVLDGLRQAVSIRQRAAVDVGVLLSGGVASSLLVGLLREAGVDNLSTFSIGFADAGGGVDEAEVEMAADLVDKPLHLALARQAHAEAHGRGEQIQVRVERVAHDGLSECRASGDHVGEVHECAIRYAEVEVEIAQADVAVEQQRFFAELRERHAGERGE